MRGESRASTLRAQFLLIVAGGAVIPLGLFALWLTSSGVRAGETLLRRHLDQSGDQFVAAVNARWQFRRGDLLLLAENEVTTRALTRGAVSAADSQFLNQLVGQVQRAIPSVELSDRGGHVLWSSTPASRRLSERDVSGVSLANVPAEPTFTISFGVRDSARTAVGTLRATLALAGLIPADSARPIVPGARLGVRESATGEVLVRLHRELPFTTASRVKIASEPWLATTRTIAEPGLDIVLAAPVTPYVGPFREAGRIGIIALILVTGAVLALTGALTTRVTRPLRDLAEAADAVSRGELDRRVASGGPLEVRRVGGAFNVMTESLRSTLDALSQRDAMAAVGEFATALSHDIRNALTSIKVDIERTAHRPMDEARGSAVLHRALNNVARLESLVSGALRLARGDHAALVTLDVRQPVRAAAEIVAGAFTAVPATLTVEVPDEPVQVNGDAKALEQLLANVLFNAAQAVRPGGHGRIRVAHDTGAVVIEIADDGSGMDDEQIARLDQPFYSSKLNGTGLGLPIARQIAVVHGGELVIVSRPGQGTTVRLQLPARVNEATTR
jgi:signal transduction histidine kinase